jgi:hypothetical protein
MTILIKVYDNMNYYKFDHVNFEYGFKFYIYKYVIQNNYKCDSLKTLSLFMISLSIHM